MIVTLPPAIIFLALALSSGSDAYRLAQRAEQDSVERATYEGGWPLGASQCPSDAPISCNTRDGTINQNCCPSGNTCFTGNLYPYCCPTSTDCYSQVSNLPVCANPDWNMFSLVEDENNFFCCENGQIGVSPQEGYAGICEASDQTVPVSLLATMVSQIGGTSVTPFGGFATGETSGGSQTTTAVTGSITTGGNTPGGNTPEGNTSRGNTSGGSSSTGSSSSSSATSSSSNNTPSSASTVSLSNGAIAGIAVGGAVVLFAILFASWRFCRSRQPKQGYQYTAPSNPMYGPTQPHAPAPQRPYDPVMERSGSPVVQEYKPTTVVYTQHTPPVPELHTGTIVRNEVQGTPGTYGRAELSY